MDNKYTSKLEEHIKGTIENAQKMSSLLLSQDFENNVLKDLTSEQKEKFYNSDEGKKYIQSKSELSEKLKELENIIKQKNGGNSTL